MADRTILYLVRHAQSRPSNRRDEPDWQLSDVGRRQARQLSPLLAPLGIDRIVSSPYTRCMDTIRPFAEDANMAIDVDDDLRERRITIGLRKDFEAVMARSWRDFDFALPGCETSQEAQRRMGPAIERIVRKHSGRSVAVCSHGNAISLFLHALDAAFGIDDMLALRNPDVVRILADGHGLRRDAAFELPGLDDVATNHSESPIEW